MKRNLGNLDKTLRVLLAVVVAILYFSNVISGTLAIILGAVAIIFVLTSMVNFCPLYAALGLNSWGSKKTSGV